MIPLFKKRNDVRLLEFLESNKSRATLLSTPQFTTQLKSAESKLAGQDHFDFDIMVISTRAFKQLRERKPFSESGRVYVVADPENESDRITQLEGEFSHLKFVGLGRDLLPVLVAKSGSAIFRELPSKLKVKRITLLLATPRSGSMLVAAILSDLGVGNMGEHLRRDLLEALKTNYTFDRKAALRNFLNVGAKNGHVGSKLITHFLADYFRDIGDFGIALRVCKGLPVDVISLDREDKVAQMVSAYLASRRKVWHVKNAGDKRRLNERRPQRLDFKRALARYFEVQQDTCRLKSFEAIFPIGLELNYERDVIGLGVEGLAEKLSKFLALEETKQQLPTASAHERLSGQENSELIDEFTKRFEMKFRGRLRRKE